ncbi:MAG: hypothetical protein Q7J29_13130 [Stagnimonas sp.]|nr:hypothetical protein [Stagnimonas sp.]
MKRTTLLLLAATLPTLAQAEWMTGLRGGLTRNDHGAGDLQAALSARGHAVDASVDSRDTAGIVSLGYRASRLLSLEASLGTLGRYRATLQGGSGNAGALATDLVQTRPAGGEFVGLALRQDLPITPRWSLVTRLGAFGWQLDEPVRGTVQDSSTSKGGGLMLGFAAQYALSGPWSLAVGGDAFHQGDRGTVQLLHAGVEYRFGK